MAKQLLEGAYTYSIKIKGLSPYQEMVMLYTLGDLSLQLGDLNSSLKHLQNAIILGNGISSYDLPYCYLKLATVYSKLGVLSQARNNALESQKLAKIFDNFDVQLEASALIEELDGKAF